MGTVGEVTAVHRDADRASAAIDAALAELQRVERLMSRFQATSDIGRANAAAGGAVVVSGETAGVVRRAVAWAEASGGRFDPALGVVSEVWDVGSRLSPPSAAVTHRLAGRSLYRSVDLGDWRGQPAIRLADRDVHLDLGGIAKGHGVDRAVAVLRDHGIEDGIVSVGGDLYALGRRPDGSPWRVGIRSPVEPSQLIGTFDASDEGVATSGDYERFFRYRGVVYHHLMDPATAAPIRSDRHSVTVRAACCRDADAGATAAFGLGPDAADRLLARLAAASLVRVG
jgi:thiamine biosynthesis lipoprotein